MWDKITGHASNLNYNMNSAQLGEFIKANEAKGMKIELLVTYTLGADNMYFAAYMSARPGNTRCEYAGRASSCMSRWATPDV